MNSARWRSGSSAPRRPGHASCLGGRQASVTGPDGWLLSAAGPLRGHAARSSAGRRLRRVRRLRHRCRAHAGDSGATGCREGRSGSPALEVIRHRPRLECWRTRQAGSLDEEAGRLHRLTGGNPFLLTELLKLPSDRRTGPGASRGPTPTHSTTDPSWTAPTSPGSAPGTERTSPAHLVIDAAGRNSPVAAAGRCPLPHRRRACPERIPLLLPALPLRRRCPADPVGLASDPHDSLSAITHQGRPARGR